MADQTLQLDLKKVELKDFARTDLIKYDNQTEVDETRLAAVPQDLTHTLTQPKEANEGRDLRDKGNVKAVTRNVAT